MQVSGATAMGPQVDGGTLVLVGGRRLLLATDGSTKAETAPSPEPLQQVVVVPVANGGKRIIARGNTGLFRLDDPLGTPKPLAQSESDLRLIAAYPGLIVVWTYGSDSPRFVDVETGKFKLVPTLPSLPIRAVAFRDDKEGAAIFEGVGVAVTNDGGATWKRVTEDVNGDALRLQGVKVHDGKLFGFVYEDGLRSPIDVAQARLGRAEDPPAETNAPALIRWIRATGTDPIAAAASSGVEVGEHAALVAGNGLIARVDLKSGAITALEEFAKDVNSTPCSFQRAGSWGWLACPVSEQPNSDIYDPFAIMRVSLDGTNIKPERPAIIRSGETELRTSPSGGVMVLGPCSPEAEGELCIRQPDGRWLTVSPEIEVSTRAAGPLSDGRVAFLRNMWPGDKPEPTDGAGAADEEDEVRDDAEIAEDPEGRPDEREVPDGKRLYIASFGEGHKETRIATIAWRPHGDIRIQSNIQEDADHNLHLIVADDDGVYAIVQPVDKEARIPQRIEGMMEARLRGSRGIAVGNDGIRATTDGGRTWTGVPLPVRTRDALGSIDSYVTDPTTFGVSEVGMLLATSVRLGWGNTDNFDEPPMPVFDSTLLNISRPATPEKLLTCTVDAGIQGTPALAGTAMIDALFAKKQALPKGTRRSFTVSSSNRDGVMGTMARFGEEGQDKPGSLPTKWTIEWFDPGEIGGKPRTWSTTPPKNTPWGAQIRFVQGVGARALFTVRVAGKSMLVRTKPSGGAEMLEVASDLLPTNDVVFGSDKGEPIAWLRDNSLIVWLAGEAPRVIGYVSYRSSRVLGEPTKDGVPVLIGAQDWSAMRIFPIPAAPKKGPAPTPLAPTLEGWSSVPNLSSHVGRLGVCPSKPKGAIHFPISRSYGRGVIDSGLGSLGNIRYEVYLNGLDACVAQMAAIYGPDRSSPRAVPATPNAPKKAAITFVRADFAAKRAEGGTRGLPAKDVMHKLTCTLEERK